MNENDAVVNRFTGAAIHDGRTLKEILRLHTEWLSDRSVVRAILRAANLSDAILRAANLSDAILSDAILSGADLSSANLSDANLIGADLRRAILSGARIDLDNVPRIPDIHRSVYAAASRPNALNMSTWHSCGTTHCRGGWITTLAGEAGRALEERLDMPTAAALIYMASDPTLERIPDFYSSNETALADMKRLAEMEANRATV
jgi:hypothetical protein